MLLYIYACLCIHHHFVIKLKIWFYFYINVVCRYSYSVSVLNCEKIGSHSLRRTHTLISRSTTKYVLRLSTSPLHSRTRKVSKNNRRNIILCLPDPQLWISMIFTEWIYEVKENVLCGLTSYLDVCRTPHCFWLCSRD